MRPVDWVDGYTKQPPKTKKAIMFGCSTKDNMRQTFFRTTSKAFGNALYFLYDFSTLTSENLDSRYPIYPTIPFDSHLVADNHALFDAVLAQILIAVSNGNNIWLYGKKMINAHEEHLVQVQIDLIDSI